MERYRIVADVGLYHVTFTVTEWLPGFIEEAACKIVTDSFNFCIQKKYLGVNAYVIMPTHLHAILFDVQFNAERLKHTLDDIRKFTGRQLLDYSAKHLPRRLLWYFINRRGRTGCVGFGNRRNILLVFIRRHFGSRKRITCITIPVVKD